MSENKWDNSYEEKCTVLYDIAVACLLFFFFSSYSLQPQQPLIYYIHEFRHWMSSMQA